MQGRGATKGCDVGTCQEKVCVLETELRQQCRAEPSSQVCQRNESRVCQHNEQVYRIDQELGLLSLSIQPTLPSMEHKVDFRGAEHRKYLLTLLFH